jgi:RNA polymerase sigma factor (sigma-70 family)
LNDGMTDAQALAEFVKTRSAEAFAVLVRNYVDLVFSAALRGVGNAEAAEDVTQTVFIVLSRRAAAVRPQFLAGWLVNTARLAAKDAKRAAVRRGEHERAAVRMRAEVESSSNEPIVEQLTPFLDDALARLGELDRSAVVLRFLQGVTFARVGEILGISEEAARKRVNRAVEKLRAHMLGQGVAANVGGLVIALAANQAKVTPAVVTDHILGVALSQHSAAAGTLAKGVASAMKLAKVKVAMIVMAVMVGVVGGGGFGVIAAHRMMAVAQTPISAQTPTTMAASNYPGTVNLIGAVPHPGMYKRENMTLFHLINNLGGLPAGARQSTYVMLLRGRPPDQVPIYRNLLVARIVDGTEADLPLVDGDMVVVVDGAKSLDDLAATQRQQGKIEPHDRLLIAVGDLRQVGAISKIACRVDSKGNISLPLLDAVKVGGGTLTYAETRISKAYFDANLIANAQITVNFEETGTEISMQSASFQPGDHLRFTVDDLNGQGVETAGKLVVAPDGTIKLPLITRLKISGLSEEQAEKAAIAGYHDAQLIIHATLTIERISPAEAAATP